MQNSDEFITWLTTLTNLLPKHGYFNAQTALIKLRSLEVNQSIIPKKKLYLFSFFGKLVMALMGLTVLVNTIALRILVRTFIKLENLVLILD